MCSNVQRGYLLVSCLYVVHKILQNYFGGEIMKKNGLRYAHDLLALISAAGGKSFYWIAGELLHVSSNPLDDLPRDWIGGVLYDDTKLASLASALALATRGRSDGITLLGEINKGLTFQMISGLKNGEVVTVLRGWDEGQKIDLMLALVGHFSLTQNVVFRRIIYNYETIEERDFGITPFETMHGKTEAKNDNGINQKCIVVKTPLSPSKYFEIQHSVTEQIPFNGIDLQFTTDRPEEMINFIAENTELPTDRTDNTYYVTYHPKDDSNFRISAVDSKNK